MVVLTLALGGCAGFHIYDAEREKIAQGAKKSFEAADIKTTIVAARENHTALTEAEVAQARRTVGARRNLLLSAIAGDEGCEPAVTAAATTARPATAAPGPPAPAPVQRPFYESFRACIDRELSWLVVIPAGVDPKAVLDQLRRAVATLEVFSDGLATDRARVRVLFRGLELPPCAPGTPLSATPPADLEQEAAKRAHDERIEVHYAAFVQKCEAYQKAFDSIVQRATGRYLVTAVRDWMDARTELARDRQAATALKTKYQNALTAYEKAVADLEKGESKEAREKFDQAVAVLKDATDAFEKVGGVLGVKELSEERLAALDTVIAALQGGQLDPKKYDAGVRRAVGVLVTLPTFADRAIDIARLRQAPPLGPLVLEKELHNARATAANRQIQRAEERVAWLERRMTAQRDRAIRLLEARRRLDAAPLQLAAGPPCHGDEACGRQRLPATAVQVFSDAVPAAVRLQLRRAMIEYADSFSIDATMAAEADYRLVALQYETALDRSEDAVKEWQMLIAVPIDRLIAYHSSGMTPAELAALVTHALGLGLIGVGVNR